MVGSFSLDAKPHVGRILAHVHRHIRKLALYFRIRQVIVGRQILASTVGHDDALLKGRSWLEEHVGKLGPINTAKENSAGQDEQDEEYVYSAASK